MVPVLRNSLPCKLLFTLSLCMALNSADAANEKKATFDSPKETLRKAIFEKSDQIGCKTVSTTPQGGIKVDEELNGFIKLILDSLKTSSPEKMRPLFHKRMDVSKEQINTTFNRLNTIYRTPYEISIHSLWALNTVDGTPNGLSCEDGNITAYPLYGYPLQFGLWVQVMGQLELGRIYISLVPSDGRWNIGSFHSQQWTHDSKDFATWYEEGVKNARMGYPEAAFVKYDIASKLLNGGGFIDLPMQDNINDFRDKTFTKEAWQKRIQSILRDWDIGYSASMLVAGGGGILVRLKTKVEISLVDMQADCEKLARTLIKEPFHNYLQGVRCSYVLPREDPTKEGLLGGMFLKFSDLKPKQED